MHMFARMRNEKKYLRLREGSWRPRASKASYWANFRPLRILRAFLSAKPLQFPYEWLMLRATKNTK